MRYIVWLAVITGMGLASFGEDPLDLDPYGGLKSLTFGPAKCFRTHDDGARSWLVTPAGGAFLSLGVCHLSSAGDIEQGTGRQPYRENYLQKRGSVEQWASVARGQLQEWGINTLGAWCSEELRSTIPYTIILDMSAGLWSKTAVPDFFSPDVEKYIRDRAPGGACVNDPFLLGYYLDNELPWGKDWRFGPDLFPGYVALPPEAPGKKKLVAFFKERYQTPERFAAVWNADLKDWSELEQRHKLRARDEAKGREDREAFVLLVARQYFKTATEAIRANDKDHMILGCRFVWATVPGPALQAAGEYCDVVSINYYEPGWVGRLLLWLWPNEAMRLHPDLTFKAFHDLAKKPLLVTEFSFRSMDSGMPNTYPPPWLIQPNVATQRQRADKFEQCATTWMAQPYFVGYHWFQYMDEPKAGRAGDGENGNYGLVTIDDEPYPEFVNRVKTLNHRVWDLHRASGQPK